ncbi:MAG TPA: LacI family DNA-binding transcriptional regulator [Acidimicrobiales bacterium]|nr:LacI family DNA-binding transcriptional regulator [Acidimicrobiales bacterium]
MATAAGVSVATVSRALRGLPNVAPATRARVIEVAAALSYRPDPHAARLAAGRTTTVGMAVPSVHPWYFAQVVGGVERVLAPAGYDLLLYAVDGEDARRRFLAEAKPFRKRVDGLVVVDLRITDDEAADLAATGVRLVTIGRATPSFPSVTIDNVAGATAAVEHLVELGHRHIAFVGDVDDNPLGFAVPELRRSSYRAVLDRHGLTRVAAWEVGGRFSIQGGTDAGHELLALDPRPTAIFAASDEMAMGVLVAARELGLAVPGDLSVVGFDDHDAAGPLGLTTVRQLPLAHGAAAAGFLLDVIAGTADHLERWEAPTELIRRASTAPPRGAC